MADVQLMGLLNATLQAATLLFIAALGELITEKSGILNLCLLYTSPSPRD